MVRLESLRWLFLGLFVLYYDSKTFTKICLQNNFSFEDICQIRLDFVDADLQQPASTTGTTAGECVDTILAITAGTSSSSIFNNPPSLCGTLTGQHGNFMN